MADVDFDEFELDRASHWAPRGAGHARLTQITHLAGAVCSVALVVGLAFWGYRLAVRDVNGVPVIKAMAGPMRIAPENPGGEVADHQGLAVNTVAALGTAAPPPDRLVLAPRPVDLAPEDSAGLTPLDAAASPQAADGASDLATAPLTTAPLADDALAQPQDDVAATDTLGPDPDAVAMALAEALAEPITDPIPAETATADNATGSATLRPRPRPSSISANVAASADLGVTLTDAAPVSATGVAEVDPASIPAGTRLVQLGAFDTPEQARAEWTKLSNQFADAMAGKALVVQAAESGGRSFYRLRAHGFADESSARGFCTTLLEQNASCIPVEQR
ncbi:SPOR domain-containing protein [Paragemmobacter ruber]|uniref:SPOR domain-containing protein n=1 Tax=Paragemmobacter ruber TaxID=1985673 RepID=A0ABW9Y7M0_9RHOB|nr:SPOR domain-containing protein [Rhodobacter ruber]NBE08500.1 SPOR domain-containing protein [Rhodobacter ruber]